MGIILENLAENVFVLASRSHGHLNYRTESIFLVKLRLPVMIIKSEMQRASAVLGAYSQCIVIFPW